MTFPDIFDRVETWVFDLDNTLYPASSHVFDQISRRMTEASEVSAQAAEQVRQNAKAAPIRDAVAWRLVFFITVGMGISLISAMDLC